MERIQNKVAWALVMALSLLVIAALAGVVRGGPLDPTAPPGSTGKNVITQLPFTISQEGSYVVNGNLTGVAPQNGITVNASNVTIDLQGFELIGVNSAGTGISASSSFVNVAVRNGTVKGPWAGGISLAGLVSQVEDVRVHSTGGIGISTGAITTLRDSIATTNGGTEILVGDRSTLESCTAAGNGTAGNGIQVGDDSVITGCTASNNGGAEIIAGVGAVLENCVADGNLTAGDGISVGGHAVVRGCSARNNGTTSSHAEIRAGDGSLVEDCEANGHNGSGAGAGDGIVIVNLSVVRGCASQYNQGSGIWASGGFNRIEGNNSNLNTIDGITIGLPSASSTASNNRVENNQVATNARNGVYLGTGTAGNLVTGNNGRGNGLGPSSNYAQLGDGTNQMVVSIGTSGVTNPWSNISGP